MEQKEMDELLKKAEVLIEALPYIQQFNRKIRSPSSSTVSA